MKRKNSLQKTIVNISHDLKTPLTSALGYVELLQKYDCGEEQHKYESIIIDKLKQLSQLIEDFLLLLKSFPMKKI
ncbi:MAG: histidine kinase dimerization/phospho-acceptor domain-containing protein [Thomasclavelia ramosa]